jgi:hypothetical protein
MTREQRDLVQRQLHEAELELLRIKYETLKNSKGIKDEPKAEPKAEVKKMSNKNRSSQEEKENSVFSKIARFQNADAINKFIHKK